LFTSTYSEAELEMRRITIIEGISQDLKYSEIAAKLGINQWTILNEVKIMHHNRDLRLKDAESARNGVRVEKAARLTSEKICAKQEQAFFSMTGLTLQEKSFQNMIDFYRPQLARIMDAHDQSAAIMALPKGERITMQNNGIIDGKRGSLATWKVTKRTKEYFVIAKRE